MNIGVVGSRTFNNYPFLKNILDRFIFNTEDGRIAIISGGADGADSLAERYCKEHNIIPMVFKPEWDKYPGKSAAAIRNQKIVDYSDFIIAFWDGKSKGTKMTINFARQAKKEVFIHWEDRYEN